MPAAMKAMKKAMAKLTIKPKTKKEIKAEKKLKDDMENVKKIRKYAKAIKDLSKGYRKKHCRINVRLMPWIFFMASDLDLMAGLHPNLIVIQQDHPTITI